MHSSLKLQLVAAQIINCVHTQKGKNLVKGVVLEIFVSTTVSCTLFDLFLKEARCYCRSLSEIKRL